MNNISKFISSIITEASLDSRIPNGVVNLENIEHIQVVAEAIYDACENENIVNEFVESFVDEGKYPDRQAYNKDGWLVTFPSKEYRDAAIKKGTHAISDPTHGRGGMNLYYKRKGKQKRQTQQATTSVTTNADQKQPAVQVNPAQPKPQVAQTSQTQSQTKTQELPPEGDDETPLSDKDIEQLKAKAAAMYGKKKPTASQPTSSTSPTVPAAVAPEAPTPALSLIHI